MAFTSIIVYYKEVIFPFLGESEPCLGVAREDERFRHIFFSDLRRDRSLKTVQLEVRPVYHKTDDRIRSHVFLCTLAYYLQWHLKQRLEPLFAADGTNEDRQWTVRNVIERLAAIRREKIAMVPWSSRKSPRLNPTSKTILDYLKVRL